MVVLLHAFEWPKVTSFTECISNIHIEHETASAKYNVKNKQFTFLFDNVSNKIFGRMSPPKFVLLNNNLLLLLSTFFPFFFY